ncbi:hypothetical protein Chor_005710, partial [Crotalus horridus]
LFLFPAALKDQGNDAFSKGDYASAVQNYTEGLKKQKDMPALYTNRAQAYIKLRKYEKAISNCSWALRARECYLKILEIDPQKEKLCKARITSFTSVHFIPFSPLPACQFCPFPPSDCIHKIDLEEKKLCEEERAAEDFKSGKLTAVTVNEMLQKLSKPDQDLLYYAGGIRLLTDLVQACECPVEGAAPD